MKWWHVIIHEDSVANKICHVSSSLRVFSIMRDQHICMDLSCSLFLVSFFLNVCSQDFLIFITFKENHNPLFPVETKMYPLPQCSIFSSFHFEVKAFFEYIGWFNSIISIIKCLSAVKHEFKLVLSIKFRVSYWGWKLTYIEAEQPGTRAFNSNKAQT